MFVRAWEREGNYCTAWVLCRYCNNTERSDPFDSIHREKFVSPEKKKKTKELHQQLIRGFVNGKETVLSKAD